MSGIVRDHWPKTPLFSLAIWINNNVEIFLVPHVIHLVPPHIFAATRGVTKSMCWDIVARTVDSSGVGLVIFQKPMSSSCYETREDANPPLCENQGQPNSSWYSLMLQVAFTWTWFFRSQCEADHSYPCVGMCLWVAVSQGFQSQPIGLLHGQIGSRVDLSACQVDQKPMSHFKRTQGIGLPSLRMCTPGVLL